MTEVIIYTTKVCPYCVRAKMLLQKKGLNYKEIDASPDNVRAQMIEKAGGMRTVPQIFINGEHVGGSDDLYALDSAGELDKLING